MSKLSILKEWLRLEGMRAALIDALENLPAETPDSQADPLSASLGAIERRIVNLPAVTASQAVRRLEIALGPDLESPLKGDVPSFDDLMSDAKRLSVNIGHVTIPLHLALAAIVAGPMIGALIVLTMAVLP